MAKTITTSPGAGLSDQGIRTAIGKLQTAVCDRVLNSPGLVIGSSSKKAPKIANTTYFVIDGALGSKTTAEVTLTSANNVANAKYNVIALTMIADGTVTATNGTAADTLATVVLPSTPASSVLLGYVVIHPTGTGGFVGGTTDLDDATVVPNAAYISAPFGFDPNALSL